MVNNSLTKTNQNNTITYTSGGEQVKLSPSMIKNYLVAGNGNVSDQEVMMFMSLCKFQKLNPFLREAYLIKYGNSPATMVVGKEVLLKRAMRSGKLKGIQNGIVVLTKDGSVAEREGTIILPNEQLIGGWAKVFIDGYDVPFYSSVNLSEYSTGKSNWATKPSIMIQKCALAQALRNAFPEDMGGLYDQSEIPESQVAPNGENVVLSESVVEVPTIASEPTEVKVTSQVADEPQNATESVSEGIDNILYPDCLG